MIKIFNFSSSRWYQKFKKTIAILTVTILFSLILDANRIHAILFLYEITFSPASIPAAKKHRKQYIFFLKLHVYRSSTKKRFISCFIFCAMAQNIKQDMQQPTLPLFLNKEYVQIIIFFSIFFWGIIFFLFVFSTASSPPLRFHCADGCWDRTQDRCNLCIGSQTL
jgi:hypothetical protein